MERTRVNIVVGLFMVLGIAALAYLSVQLGRVFGAHPLQADLGQRCLDPLGHLVRRRPDLLAEREGYVAPAGHRVEERAALEDDTVAPADRVEWLAAQARDLLVVHEDAAGIGL